jgi:predicted permease
MTTLIDVLLPIFLVAAIAALAQPRLRLDVRTLSRVGFYLFAPCLVFDALVSSDVSGREFMQIAAVLLLTTLILWVLGQAAARLLRLQGPTQAAFLAAILLMNGGNYGLPVTLFAFGEAGLARATLFFTVNALITSSFGVYLTARGRASAGSALRRVARVPLVYAAAVGLIFNLASVPLPEPLLKAVGLLGQAAVPAMLLVLGLKLAETFQSERSTLQWPALGVVAATRLLLAPALAWVLAAGIGLNGLARDVVTLESAMPTAVMTTILATEFESDPPFAALCVLVTTLASLPTVAILLNLLA